MKKFLSFLLTFVMLFSLTMPAMAAEVTGDTSGDVTASYTPTYTVSVSASENGAVTADKTAAAEGATVTLTITPADRYELDALTVSDGTDTIDTTKGDDGKYTFTMPAKAVTVTATFKEVVATTFNVTIDASISALKTMS